MFLPDRYIKGECPKCGAKDQYGDACENCGAVYAPTDLKNPYSTISGATPVLQVVRALLLPAVGPALRRVPARVDATCRRRACSRRSLNKAQEWLGAKAARRSPTGTSRATRPTSASRSPTRRASISTSGSMRRSATSRASRRTSPSDAASTSHAFLAESRPVEQVHFIGKDIVYFHTLFWPAMLKFAGAPYKVPDNVYVHGFITVSGEKMSKSRGTGISPDVYLDLGLNPEWLRYYIAAKLNARVEDIDFNPDDFIARVNSDLIGKYVNIASRAATFLTRHFDGELATPAETADDARDRLADRRSSTPRRRAEATRRASSASVLREVMRLADRLNEAFDEAKPWELAKDPAQARRAADVCIAIARMASSC